MFRDGFIRAFMIIHQLIDLNYKQAWISTSSILAFSVLLISTRRRCVVFFSYLGSSRQASCLFARFPSLDSTLGIKRTGGPNVIKNRTLNSAVFV